MRRTLIPAVLAVTTACSTTSHTYADESPKGVPKSARAHCRSHAERLANEAGGAGLKEDIRRCLDGLLKADCAEELTRVAEQLERQGKGEASFFYRFPGGWDRDTMEDEVELLKEDACTSSKAMAAALSLFHGIRHSSGGRIPWATFGEPRPGFCREGCPAK